MLKLFEYKLYLRGKINAVASVSVGCLKDLSTTANAEDMTDWEFNPVVNQIHSYNSTQIREVVAVSEQGVWRVSAGNSTASPVTLTVEYMELRITFVRSP